MSTPIRPLTRAETTAARTITEELRKLGAGSGLRVLTDVLVYELQSTGLQRQGAAQLFDQAWTRLEDERLQQPRERTVVKPADPADDTEGGAL